jgi:hypothetical protein
MAIQCLRVDNSEILDGIDRVSGSITDCINLAESILRKRKPASSIKKLVPNRNERGTFFQAMIALMTKSLPALI